MEHAAATILIVDDSPTTADIFACYLEQFFSVLVAENGEKGFQMAQEQSPDLILMDVKMPGMDGLTLMKTLSRDNGHGFSGHAIVITAYGDYDRQRQAMHHGAFDFLNKPLDLSDSEITMARALKVQADLKARIARLEHEKKKLETRKAELEQELQAAYDRIDALESQNYLARETHERKE